MEGRGSEWEYVCLVLSDQSKFLGGSIQVSGDVSTLLSLRPKVWVGVGLGSGLGLREGRVGTSPETWIDPGDVFTLPSLRPHLGSGAARTAKYVREFE